jgi:hypothetical protein
VTLVGPAQAPQFSAQPTVAVPPAGGTPVESLPAQAGVGVEPELEFNAPATASSDELFSTPVASAHGQQVETSHGFVEPTLTASADASPNAGDAISHRDDMSGPATPTPHPPLAITDELVSQVAARVLSQLPKPAAVIPDAPSAALSDTDVDKVARRVIELYTAQLERIAWEVMPDMAEMIIRKRISELEAAAETEN